MRKIKDRSISAYDRRNKPIKKLTKSYDKKCTHEIVEYVWVRSYYKNKNNKYTPRNCGYLLVRCLHCTEIFKPVYEKTEYNNSQPNRSWCDIIVEDTADILNRQQRVKKLSFIRDENVFRSMRFLNVSYVGIPEKAFEIADNGNKKHDVTLYGVNEELTNGCISLSPSLPHSVYFDELTSILNNIYQATKTITEEKICDQIEGDVKK